MIDIPSFIISELQRHIRDNCVNAEYGYEFSNQDEDTITGDFLGKFRTNWKSSKGYSWRFTYNKIRGRGSGALEKTFGTDGIITLSFIDGNITYYKSMVFQAKKNFKINISQQLKMNKFFPNGNIFFIYTPNGYFAQGSQYSNIKICKLLAEEFLPCKFGIEGLYYDYIKNTFVFPGIESKVFTTMHAMSIDVKK